MTAEPMPLVCCRGSWFDVSIMSIKFWLDNAKVIVEIWIFALDCAKLYHIQFSVCFSLVWENHTCIWLKGTIGVELVVTRYGLEVRFRHLLLYLVKLLIVLKIVILSILTFRLENVHLVGTRLDAIKDVIITYDFT